MRFPIQIGVIIFRKAKNDYEFLLLKRIPEKQGFWQSISGGLESKDKSHLDCAFREAFEEAGVKKENVIRVINDFYFYKYEDPDFEKGKITLMNHHFYAFQINEGTIVTIEDNPVDEHEEFRWVNFDEALKLLKWENNKKAFRLLKDIID